MVRSMALCVLLLSVSVSADTTTESSSEFKQQAQQRIQTFAKTLQGELKGAMQSGGPVAAVEVCHQRAPEIASELSTDGWTIGRISLKARNPSNQPDAWQTAMLKQFEQDKDSGAPMGDLVAIKHQPEQTRMLKAIPTKGLCLACHGQNLAPQVQEVIQKHYPNDAATGFKAGDIRGAFSVSYQKD